MGLRGIRIIKVVPTSEEHIESLHICLDSVARERLYLGRVKARPFESIREFVQSNICNKIPQYVAVEEKLVVGWCYIIPRTVEGFTHCGVLGMGVLYEYRRKGLGALLMEDAIRAAKAFGVERVELEVFVSNIPAVKLYEKWGFVHEGVKKKARKLDGEYDDIHVMTLFI